MFSAPDNPKSQGGLAWIQRARVRDRHARAGLLLILIIAFSSKETSSCWEGFFWKPSIFCWLLIVFVNLMAENMAFECVKNERKSKVWIFFLLNKEERKAKCISCSLIMIIRKDGSTNYLIQHLKSKHFKDYKLTKPNKNENTKGQ